MSDDIDMNYCELCDEPHPGKSPFCSIECAERYEHLTGMALSEGEDLPPDTPAL
jgi:hypothetical protein